ASRPRTTAPARPWSGPPGWPRAPASSPDLGTPPRTAAPPTQTPDHPRRGCPPRPGGAPAPAGPRTAPGVTPSPRRCPGPWIGSPSSITPICRDLLLASPEHLHLPATLGAVDLVGPMPVTLGAFQGADLAFIVPAAGPAGGDLQVEADRAHRYPVLLGHREGAALGGDGRSQSLLVFAHRQHRASKPPRLRRTPPGALAPGALHPGLEPLHRFFPMLGHQLGGQLHPAELLP